MAGVSMVFKIPALLVLVLTCLGYANGLNCYKCAQLHKDLQVLSGARTENLCKTRMQKGLTTTCPPSKPYCLRILSTVLNGKQADFRLCGEELYKRAVGPWVNCRPLTDLPFLQMTIGPEKFKPDNGTLCVCNTDKCNL